MKEYKISDIENLEKYVYDTIAPQVKELKDDFEKMGFTIKCKLKNISQENDSLIQFTIRNGKDSFTFSLCFIAKGNNGGYFVSPIIKEGNILDDALLLIQQVKTTLLDRGFDKAKEIFDGMQKDCYKGNSTVYKILKGLKITGMILAVLALGALLALFIIVL